jgi:hypothetical protein
MCVATFIMYIILYYISLLLPVSATEMTNEPIMLTEEIGTKIDLDERNKYGLFLFVKNFESAVLQQTQEGNYIFIIKYFDQQTQAVVTREIEITAEALQKIREKIEKTNIIKGEEETETKPVESTVNKPQTELVISSAYLITKNFDDDVATRELLLSLERYHNMLGVGINLLTTYYITIISINFCAAYPRNFPLTPIISGGFCISAPLLLNYSGGIKLSLHQHLAVRLEYRAWYEVEYSEIFETFYTAGLNITF